MSFPVSNVFEVSTELDKKYQLEPNEFYQYPTQDPITALKTCPLTSEIKVIEAPRSAGDSFVFDSTFGKTQFLSNCMKMYFTIPFTVTLAEDATDPPATEGGAAVPVDITEANFMDKLFNNNADICYSQYGILQAISNLQISLNNNSLISVNNVLETFCAVSQYYASGDVDEWFQASQPDRFQSFEQYVGTTGQTLKYVDELGKKTYTSVSPLNEANIFSSRYQKSYNARTPQWTWVSQGSNTKREANVECTFFCYLPLTFGSVPSTATAFSGINRLNVAVNMRGNLAAYVFNMVKTAGSYRYSSITVNSTAFIKATSKLLVQVYAPPQYMREAMVDKRTGLMQPYSIDYPRILCSLGASYDVPAGELYDFNTAEVQTNSVPKSIYISLMKLKDGTFQKCATTPINYGLIQNLTVSIDSAVTNFNDVMSLNLISDSNGYDQLDPIGRLLKGYTVKLDVGKDLSLPGDMVIGQSGVFRIAVKGKFINQGDTAAKYQLQVIVVNNASLNFDGNDFSLSSGVLIDSAMLSSGHFMKQQYDLYGRSVNVIGAGVFGDIGKFVKKNAVNIAKNAWKNREKIASTIGDVANMVKTIKGGSKMGYSNVSGTGRTTILGAGDAKTTIFK